MLCHRGDAVTAGVLKPVRPPTAGFTLVELMVSITISMILMVVILNAYLSSRTSYRMNDTNARLQQDVRFTLANLGEQLREAGYGKPAELKGMSLASELDVQNVSGFLACDYGFKDPLNKPDCADAGANPGFQVAYQVVEDLSNPAAGVDPNIGAGTDCNGQTANAPAGIAINRYYLALSKDGSRSLYCLGNGNATPHPILHNVNSMRISYGVDTRTFSDTPSYLNEAGTPNRYFDSIESAKTAMPDFDFKKVVNMTVCLDVSSAQTLVGPQQTYLDCDDKQVTATDHKLHFAVKSVFALRNNSATSQLIYQP